MIKDMISIIVPVYNVEDFLNRCVDSIINQTYKNLEILLINDGSKDNSGALCDELLKKDDRIRVIHKENEGLSATRNLGIKECKGEYLAFVDSDDYLTKDYCETLINTIKETDSDIASLSYKVVRTDDTVILDASMDSGLEQNEIVTYENIDIIKELLRQKTFKNFVWNKLFKRTIICDFQVGLNYEDIVFSFEVMSKIKRISYINKPCYNYLKRNSSITATISEKNLNDFGKAIYGRYELVKSNYPELMNYNMYAFLESSVALSIKYVICDRKYNSVKNDVIKFIDILLDYVNEHEKEFFDILNDYQKLCIYFMKYNTELFLRFLKERQKLKIQGKLK